MFDLTYTCFPICLSFYYNVILEKIKKKEENKN